MRCEMRGRPFYKSLSMKPKSKHLTPAQLEQIKQLYPDHSNEEIAGIMGLSKWTIKSRAEKHGWHKSKQYLHALNSERAVRCENYKRINTPEAYAKRAITRAKLYEADKMRIRWGLKQKTNRHFRIEPRARLLQRNRLERLGYIVDQDRLIAYYTPQTKRATRIEKVPRGKQVGSIHGWYDFAPLETK